MAITYPKLRVPLEECKSMKVTSGAAKTAGEMEKIQDLVGFHNMAVAISTLSAFIYYAPKVVLPCVAAPTAGYVVGEKMYFKASTKSITNVASGNTLCSFVTKAVAQAATEVEVDLQGGLAI